MIQTILVPVDGSSFSEQAIPVALGIAQRTGATLELTLVHDSYADAAAVGLGIAGPPPYQLPANATLEDARAERAEYLAILTHRVRSESRTYVRSEMVEGRIVDVLAEHARRRADLVVMSTHARGGLSRLWLGSVADSLIREVSVPVMLVKPNDGDTSIDTSGVHRFRSVVVALDGSSLAETVLEPMLAVLGRDRSQVLCTLVQVQSPIPSAPATTLHAASFPPTPELTGPHSTGDKYLEEVTQRLRVLGLEVKPRTVLHEQTGRAILEIADEVNADLIALATHGRGGLRRFLIGSVADEVLRGAETTVLVYRPPGVIVNHLAGDQ